MSIPVEKTIEDVQSVVGHINNSSVITPNRVETGGWQPPIKMGDTNIPVVMMPGAPVPPVETDDEIVSDCTRRAICEPGVYPAKCVAVYKIGLQKGYMGGTPRRKAIVMFELAATINDGPLAGEHYRLSKIVTAELYEKSGLVTMLRSWFGKDPTQRNGQLSRLKLSDLIGKPATVIVKHDIKDGQPNPKIADVLPPSKNAPVINSTFNPQNVPDFVKRMMAQQLPDPRRS